MSEQMRETLAVVLVFIVCMLFFKIAHAGDLPDAFLTPGATRPVDVKTLCTTSTKLVRHTSAELKAAVYSEYNQQDKHDQSCSGPGHSCAEIDHLISLELGGADEKPNLWPQAYDGTNNAHDKDRLENYLHRQVCAGKMALEEAQACIASNWITCAKQVMP